MERVWDPVSILDTILERFWWILEGFWMDFGRILAKFLEGFDLTMIRATKGMSMDGWMDGEDLIICVARLVVQKLCGPLTCDEFRVISIASRKT